MIITKCGRRMFPSLRINVSGLENGVKYVMLVDIVPFDDNRYKYHNCEWVVSGKSEQHTQKEYTHPDSPLTGSQWMKQSISFHKLKLTNNPYDKNHIILNSMHKYIPRIHIIAPEQGSIDTFQFPETVFMAVTAYQNEAITKLKIEHNPFAKGFRDGQSRKDYRAKRSSDDENEFSEERNHFNQLMSQNKYAKTNNSVSQRDNGISLNPLANKDLNKFNPMQHHHQQQQQQQQPQQQVFHQQMHASYSNMSSNKFSSSKLDSSSQQALANTAESVLYNY